MLILLVIPYLMSQGCHASVNEDLSDISNRSIDKRLIGAWKASKYLEGYEFGAHHRGEELGWNSVMSWHVKRPIAWYIDDRTHELVIVGYDEEGAHPGVLKRSSYTIDGNSLRLESVWPDSYLRAESVIRQRSATGRRIQTK